jgi:hypothetical protein
MGAAQCRNPLRNNSLFLVGVPGPLAASGLGWQGETRLPQQENRMQIEIEYCGM